MQVPTAISFRGVAESEALRSEIIEHVRLTTRVLEDILACRIVIDCESIGVHGGGRYAAYVRLAMPCIEIEGGERGERRPDPRLAVADAFAELGARLDAFVARRCRTCMRFGRPMAR